MDAADVFRQGLGSMLPRPSPYFFPGRPPVPVPSPYAWDSPDNESEAPHRIAHTLTACCRCRQVSYPFFQGIPAMQIPLFSRPVHAAAQVHPSMHVF